jgi:hypothetical protein
MNPIARLLSLVLFLTILLALAGPARAGVPLGTAFTYQGSLKDAAVNANGPYDFRFTLFDAASGGNAMSATLDKVDLLVADGLFTVELDFGVMTYSVAEAKWLQVEVRQGASTGAYTLLPRQRLTAAPAALQIGLPLAHTLNSDQTLFSIGNTGTGGGGSFTGGGGPTLNYGVEGSTWSTASQAAGVHGVASASTGTTIGVSGISYSDNGTGLVGQGAATGAFITGTGENSTGVYAYGKYRGLYAENTGSGSAVVASGQGQQKDNSTLRIMNTNPVEGMAAYLTNASNYATAYLVNTGVGQVLWLQRTSASAGDFIRCDDANASQFWVDNSGTTHTRVLEILGGSDLSEKFDVDVGDGSPLEPGTVVSIDPRREGRLVVSHEPCDRRVAGIVSGAGGVRTGMLMGQESSVASGSHPVALSGRVYCRATAVNGPIHPGDLLTTSSVPGHAMRVDEPARAQGAILGKAMGTLEHGEGLVLVLVGLQ